MTDNIIANTPRMSTLADELLQDFEDSGSEGEEEQEHGGLFKDEGDSKSNLLSLAPRATNGSSMELDGDEEDVDEDEEMAGMASAVDIEDDEEEAKAKVERMQLGGVADVRSVAGLMKTLEPVLEVSLALSCPHLRDIKSLHLLCCSIALTRRHL